MEQEKRQDSKVNLEMRTRKLADFGLYFITDSSLSKKSPFEDAVAAIKGGVKIAQYREKYKPAKQMVEEAQQIRDVCKKNNVLFIVNDRIDIAIAVDADGVHLGQDDVPYEEARKIVGYEKIIGLSANSVEMALKNQELGADYTSIGPIYPTKTKKDSKAPIGLEPIKQLKAQLKIPFVAIGGIKDSNIEEVLKAGARNIAMISAVITKENVESTVRGYITKVNSYKQ